MKKITLLFLLIFVLANMHAQNYQISFAGTGAATSVDSVKVENITQCKEATLKGSDILQLNFTVGINELNQPANHTIHIYPNPMSGYCSVEFETIETKYCLIRPACQVKPVIAIPCVVVFPLH